MGDLSLPVSRLPGVAEVARECLGLDPWTMAGSHYGPNVESPVNGAWWEHVAVDSDTYRYGEPVIPLDLPAGRLVAETWAGRVAGHARAGTLHVAWSGHLAEAAGFAHDTPIADACLFAGDLLRLCSALGVEVPAGTVPRLERAKTAEVVWILRLPGWHKRVDFVAANAVRGEILVPGLPDGDPRAALDAIVKEVCGG